MSRAGDDVAHCRRHQDLAAIGQRRDPRTDVHRHAGNIVFRGAAHLDLAGVNADPHLDAQYPHRVDDVVGTRERGARAGERGDEPVAGGVDFASAESLQFVANDGVVVVQHVAPAPVPEQRGAFGGTDDVGEHDRGQQALGVRTAPHAGDELLDLVEHRPGVAHPVQGVVTG